MKVNLSVATRRRVKGGTDEKPKFEYVGPGKGVDLGDAHAKALIDRGVAEAVEPKGKTGGSKPGKPAKKPDRVAAILDAFGDMDLEDPAILTDDGKPSTDALQGVLGWEPSADDRDEAWSTAEGAKAAAEGKASNAEKA